MGQYIASVMLVSVKERDENSILLVYEMGAVYCWCNVGFSLWDVCSALQVYCWLPYMRWGQCFAGILLARVSEMGAVHCQCTVDYSIGDGCSALQCTVSYSIGDGCSALLVYCWLEYRRWVQCFAGVMLARVKEMGAVHCQCTVG